jgi:hypothetical protein
MADSAYITKAKARFTKKFFKDPKSKCWIWTAIINKGGYGLFLFDRKDLLAHRVAYQLFVGNIPSGKLVCHTCDVRNCVNPEHLFIGTHLDNSHDMTRKGRAPDRKGVNHPHTKLTNEDIFFIRENKKTMSSKELSRRFKVSTTQINRILSKECWGHI